jgi:hypothetical protein
LTGTEEEAVTGTERGIGTEKGETMTGGTGIETGIMTGMTGTVVMTEALIVTETEKGKETGTPAGPAVMTPGAATALVLQGIIALGIMIATGRK